VPAASPVSDGEFGLAFCQVLLARMHSAVAFDERHGQGSGPFLPLLAVADGSDAGWLRIWVATDASHVDRLIHLRLLSPPVDTNLLFLFARPASAAPHFHAQVVQFAADAFVYNADLIPRLDPVDHPDYFRAVYGPITKEFWKATSNRDNACSMVSANPAVATYLSAWSIAASRPTTKGELSRVTPSIVAYLDHCLALARNPGYETFDPATTADRDRRHLALLHSDELDPRAWKGVYRVVGEDTGRRIKTLLGTTQR
jgi:hypothetical protein